MDKKRTLSQFQQRTGLEPEAALSILQSTEWDIVESYRIFDRLVRTGQIQPVQVPNAKPARMSSQPIYREASSNREVMGPPRQPVERVVPIIVEQRRAPVNNAGRYGDVSQAPGKDNRPTSMGSANQSHTMHPSMQGKTTSTSQNVFMGPRSGYDTYPAHRHQGPQAPIAQQGSWSTAPRVRAPPPSYQAAASHPSYNTVPYNDITSKSSTPVTAARPNSDIMHIMPGRTMPPSSRPVSEMLSAKTLPSSKPPNDVLPGRILPQSSRASGEDVVDKAASTRPFSSATQAKPESTLSVTGNKFPVETTKSKDLLVAGDDKSKTLVAPTSPRQLKRGISKIIDNESLVTQTRTSILHDIEEDLHGHMYRQTFILPDLTAFAADYRAFLEKDLIETSTLVSLEQAGRLNWWAEVGICQRLLPMATTGDGNCLLHAASLAMWGIHDRELMLRKELYNTLTKQSYSKALYRRWRWQQTQVNKESELIFSEEEWQQEWNGILKLASTMPRTLPGNIRRTSSCCISPVTQGGSNDDTPVVYESLEEFHVFVLAHVLQRVIIIVADTILKDACGDALAPIPFGGVYLPLECDPKLCYRSPLLLTYDAAHFSALVPMKTKLSSDNTDEKSSLPVAIPLIGPDLKLLPIHFMVDPGADFDWTKNNNNAGVGPLSTEYKVNKLQLFLDMEKLPMLHYDCDNDSDIDRRSTGSYESDDNQGCIGKDKKKDGKVSQQLQSMSKQFGSLGKTMGKKLKKNFGSVGKALKSMSSDSDKGRRVSVGSGITQSTKLPMTIVAMSEHELVWCAKVATAQSDMTDKMIKNYLEATRQRFVQGNTLMQARGEEIRRRSIGHFKELEGSTKCVNSECNMFGNPETCYLCSKCFNEQRQQALNVEKQHGKPSYSGAPSQSTPFTAKPEAVQVCGKSKFYVGDDDDSVFTMPTSTVQAPDRMDHPSMSQTKPPSPGQSRNILQPSTAYEGTKGNASQTQTHEQHKVRPTSQMLTQNDHVRKLKVDTDPKNKYGVGRTERTPSPDYDNVDYRKSCPPVFAPKVQNRDANVPHASRPCKTAGCVFFGTECTDFYCSSCYKKNQQAQATQKTRL